MLFKRIVFLSVAVALFISFLGISNPAAKEVIDTPNATVVEFDGVIKVKLAASNRWVSGAKDLKLNPGDEIKTGDDTYCILLLWDYSTIKMGDNTHIKIKQMGEDKNKVTTRVKLFVGNIWNQVSRTANKKTNFKVDAPHTLAAVRGTTFEMRSDGNDTTTYLYDGVVDVKSGEKTLELDDNQYINAGKKGFLSKIQAINRKKLSPWQKLNLEIDKQIAVKRKEYIRRGNRPPTAKMKIFIRKVYKNKRKQYWINRKKWRSYKTGSKPVPNPARAMRKKDGQQRTRKVFRRNLKNHPNSPPHRK